MESELEGDPEFLPRVTVLTPHSRFSCPVCFFSHILRGDRQGELTENGVVVVTCILDHAKFEVVLG